MLSKRLFLATIGAAILSSACTTTSSSSGTSAADKRRAIDAEVDGALGKLASQVPRSKELLSKAKGVLVFPSVLAAGFGIGGSYGQGALRVGGKTDGYYSTTAASVGLIAGAESKAVYVLFMTQEALDKFRASKGWTAGADASVTMIRTGASASVDTQTARQAVIGYALSNAGLMADLSIDGTKVNKLDL